MFEIRHAGKTVHRSELEDDAQKWAEANLAHLEDVSIAPGKPFEVFADGGFAESFDSLEQARDFQAMLEGTTAPKLSKQGRPTSETGPRFANVDVRFEGQVVEAASEVVEVPVSEMETDPAPPEPSDSASA